MADRRPSPHPVDLWLMDPGTASPAWVAQRRPLLAPEETDRAKTFGRDHLRHRHLCTRILQRLMLSRMADVAPDEWRFVPGANGKPEIVEPVGYGNIRFSISHTRGMIALALCREGEVGVDVEALDHARDIAAVAKHFFAPEEAEALLALGEAARPLRFLTLWTLKEAWLKALGTGLAGPLDAIRFRVAPDGSFTPDDAGEASHWSCATLHPTPRDAHAAPAGGSDVPFPASGTKGAPEHVLAIVWPRGPGAPDAQAAPLARWFVPDE